MAKHAGESRDTQWKKPPVGDFELPNRSKANIVEDFTLNRDFKDMPAVAISSIKKTGQFFQCVGKKIALQGYLKIEPFQLRIYESRDLTTGDFVDLKIEFKELLLEPRTKDQQSFTAKSRNLKIDYFNRKFVVVEGVLEKGGTLLVSRVRELEDRREQNHGLLSESHKGSIPGGGMMRPIHTLALAAIMMFVILGVTSCTQISEALYEPPKIVPEGRTPVEYYKMGVNYKLVGWPEQAREALSRAIKADPNGAAGKNASVYLTAYLPLKSQPQAAIDQNIMAFNQMVSGKDNDAIAAFKNCIEKYPDFEWPYGNLSSIYTRARRFKEAQAIVQTALDFNPNYLNGWLHLARALAADGDKVAAMRCVKRALVIDPNSHDAKQLAHSLEQ